MIEEFLRKNRLLKGRPLGFLIFLDYRRSDIENGIAVFKKIRCLRIKEDDLFKLVIAWDQAIYGMTKVLDEDLVDALFTNQVKQCTFFETNGSLHKNK